MALVQMGTGGNLGLRETSCWQCERAIRRVMPLAGTAEGCWCKTLHQYFRQHNLLITHLAGTKGEGNSSGIQDHWGQLEEKVRER